VTSNFTGARIAENQPRFSVSSKTIPMSVQNSLWAFAPADGSWGVTKTMCQFYKTGVNFSIQNSNSQCQVVNIAVTWTSLKPFQLSPTANVSLDDKERPSNVTFGGRINNIKATPVNGVNVARNYKLKRLNGTITSLGSSSSTLNVPTGGINLPNENKNISNVNLNTGDKICQTVTINPGTGNIRTDNGAIYGATSPASSPEVCDTVVNKPYVSFFGGDVNTCKQINTFYKPSTKVGSGVQYIAQANSSVNQFTSAFGIGSSPKVLTFANVGTSEYGGNFNGACNTRDYFTKPPATAELGTSINPSALTSGSKLYNAPAGGSIELTEGSIPNGQRTALYINGDVRITGNIGYQNDEWQTLADIPSLHVYVKGNIYIQSGVTNLTGFFVAQRDGTNKGIIYTCANGTSRMPIADILNGCSTQLKVRGAFSSYKTFFDRSKGSLRAGSPIERYEANSAAETFFLGPEMYFVSPGSVSTGGTTPTGGYQYQTVLPPLL
jgi:hypothetical protein